MVAPLPYWKAAEAGEVHDQDRLLGSHLPAHLWVTAFAPLPFSWYLSLLCFLQHAALLLLPGWPLILCCLRLCVVYMALLSQGQVTLIGADHTVAIKGSCVSPNVKSQLSFKLPKSPLCFQGVFLGRVGQFVIYTHRSQHRSEVPFSLTED